MSAVAHVRTAVSAMLDGMKFNREKLGKDCLSVCDAHDRLEQALAEERAKNVALAEQVAQLQRQRAMPGAGNFGGAPGAGNPNFGDIFGDIFKQHPPKQ